MLIIKDSIDPVTLHNNGLANLMIGSLMNMSLLIKNLTNYVQTKTDKEDAKLLRKLLTDDLSEQEQIKIIRHVFSIWQYMSIAYSREHVIDQWSEERRINFAFRGAPQF